MDYTIDYSQILLKIWSAVQNIWTLEFQNLNYSGNVIIECIPHKFLYFIALISFFVALVTSDCIN